VESGKLKKHSEELEAARKEKRKNRQRAVSPPTSDRFANATSIPFASYDSPPRSPSKFAMASEIPKYTLGDMDYEEDDDENKENSPNRKGGLRKRKRRSYKKRKTRTNKRKRSGKKGTRRRRR
jgi:hypothetical protein